MKLNRFQQSSFSLESIIYSNYIRYDRLKQLVLHEFQNTPYANCNKVNIFIDVYSIVKRLRDISDLEITKDQKYLLASGIVNMAAHYRAYFQSRHNTSSNIFVIYSDNDNKYLRSINPEYDGFMNDKHLLSKYRKYIDSNLKVLDDISFYIPNFQFKRYENAPTCAAMYDIMKYNSMIDNITPNIVITRDTINYQLVNFPDNYTVIFRPKRDVNGFDSSYSINKFNLMESYVELRANKDTKIEDIAKRKELARLLNPELFTILLSLTSVPERNYKFLLNINSALQVLYKIIIQMGLVRNAYSFFPMDVFEIINNNINSTRFNPTFAESRFRTLDMIFQYAVLESMKIELYKPNEYLHNPDIIKKINDKFFSEYPLDLNVL